MKKEFSIFIADKNEVDRFLLQSQLEPYCKNISWVANGKEALVCLKQDQYDLIFVDIQIPFFSSLEHIKVIKGAQCINKNSALIAMTPQLDQQQLTMLINTGFDECLIKPILLPELTEILNLWLSESLQEDRDYLVAILEKTAGNKKLAHTILNKLFVELPQQVETIEKALKAKDFRQAIQVTHKLHGSVRFCGFIKLQITAGNLENNLLANNSQLIKQHFMDLKKHISDFLQSKTSLTHQLSKQ